MKIFLAATSLSAEYGGPAYSVARLAKSLAESGHDVALWAADGSTGAAGQVRQLSGELHRALRESGIPEVIHDNGLWRSHNHALSRFAAATGVARIVSTRGMLEPWALAHKRMKKRAAWLLYQRRDLERAAGIHVTSASEGANVERMGLGIRITMIPNAVDLPDYSVIMRSRHSATARERETKTAVFLGRLYPVKGLPALIHAWSEVRPRDWILKIAGPDEAGHRRDLETTIDKAGLADVVSFLGAVSADARDELLRDADLFVLPTHSESYGMAVAEALAYGLPVLTTVSAPWPMLEERKCGWLAEPSPRGIAAALRDAATMDRVELESMGARARALIAEMPTWERVAEEFAALYSYVASGG